MEFFRRNFLKFQAIQNYFSSQKTYSEIRAKFQAILRVHVEWQNLTTETIENTTKDHHVKFWKFLKMWTFKVVQKWFLHERRLIQHRSVRISFSWGGGVVSKLDQHTSIDDILIQPKFVEWLSCTIKSKIFCRSTVKVAYLNSLYFETDCAHLETNWNICLRGYHSVLPPTPPHIYAPDSAISVNFQEILQQQVKLPNYPNVSMEEIWKWKCRNDKFNFIAHILYWLHFIDYKTYAAPDCKIKTSFPRTDVLMSTVVSTCKKNVYEIID